MLRWSAAVLYTALMFGANPAAADIAAADALREGDMRKLIFGEAAKPVPLAELAGMDDAPRSLAEWRGKWVVVNFWATWCGPCRKEMPGLDALQGRLGGERFQVVAVATGRNPLPALERFLEETGIVNLPVLRDPRSELAHSLGIMGLPVTLILNPEGEEVGRMIGEADWNGPGAVAVLEALIAP